MRQPIKVRVRDKRDSIELIAVEDAPCRIYEHACYPEEDECAKRLNCGRHALGLLRLVREGVTKQTALRPSYHLECVRAGFLHYLELVDEGLTKTEQSTDTLP